jgi:hypothetical protein
MHCTRCDQHIHPDVNIHPSCAVIAREQEIADQLFSIQLNTCCGALDKALADLLDSLPCPSQKTRSKMIARRIIAEDLNARFSHVGTHDSAASEVADKLMRAGVLKDAEAR